MTIDWSACELVQQDPLYVSGAPALRSEPRMMVDIIVESVETYGETPEDIREQFGIPVEATQALLSYAARRRVAL